MEEIKKEIQSLRKRTLYLSIALSVLAGSWIITSFNQIKAYETIRDYYCHSIEWNQEMNLELEKQNLELEKQNLEIANQNMYLQSILDNLK